MSAPVPHQANVNTARGGWQLARCDRGQSLVEFAFASIVFLLVMFGTIEFGIGIWRYNMVADLAQEGARWASVRGVKGSTQATAADVQTYVQSRAPSFNVTVTTSPVPGVLVAGSTVTVLVQTTYTPLTPLLPIGAMTLRHTATMTMSR